MIAVSGARFRFHMYCFVSNLQRRLMHRCRSAIALIKTIFIRSRVDFVHRRQGCANRAFLRLRVLCRASTRVLDTRPIPEVAISYTGWPKINGKLVFLVKFLIQNGSKLVKIIPEMLQNFSEVATCKVHMDDKQAYCRRRPITVTTYVHAHASTIDN